MDLLDVKKAGIPITVVGATHDLLLKVDASRHVRDVLGDSIEYFEINGGHQTYFVGNQLDVFLERMMNGMRKYNPV